MANASPELSRGDSSGAESVGVGLPPSALGNRAAKASVAGLAGYAEVLSIGGARHFQFIGEDSQIIFIAKNPIEAVARKRAPDWSSMLRACRCRNGW